MEAGKARSAGSPALDAVSPVKPGRKRLCICMVSDFFYPGLGGVEMHIYQLSQCLLQLGYKVIVVTHFRGNRHGVRYMTNGLKVYYLPFKDFVDNCTFPTLYGGFPLIRQILLRERVDIVHGHQATSNLAHECMMHAKTMGYKTIYTDHSLFGFADAACIHINKVLKFFLSDIDHAICVSHTNKENLVLRAALNPHHVSVIPNAVDATRFTPDVSRRPPPGTINVIVLSRLTYRKGIDLLVDLIPYICQKHPNVNFIIGGDGPKKLLLEETREKHRLHERVELLGAVPHSQVRDVLRRGHVFVNSSLTEAFCIAIVEAASCGLLVVSTKVGGVPEVLPMDMMRLADPEWRGLAKAVSEAVSEYEASPPDPMAFHEKVAEMYSWHDVAERTESVYQRVMESRPAPLLTRLRKIYELGPFSGKLFSFITALDYLWWRLLEWLCPRDLIDVAPDFPTEKFQSELTAKLRSAGKDSFDKSSSRTEPTGPSSGAEKAGGSLRRRVVEGA